MSNWTGMRGVQAAVGGPSQRTPSRRANRAAAVCPNSGLTAKRSRAARIMVLEHARQVPGNAPASGRWVAVGMPVTRHPPHRPVLALLTHTVLTSDIWRQTAHSATGVEPRPGGVWHQVAPENESTSIGSSGSAGVSGGTTNEALTTE